jgi:hypothetical protein
MVMKIYTVDNHLLPGVESCPFCGRFCGVEAGHGTTLRLVGRDGEGHIERCPEAILDGHSGEWRKRRPADRLPPPDRPPRLYTCPRCNQPCTLQKLRRGGGVRLMDLDGLSHSIVCTGPAAAPPTNQQPRGGTVRA